MEILEGSIPSWLLHTIYARTLLSVIDAWLYQYTWVVGTVWSHFVEVKELVENMNIFSPEKNLISLWKIGNNLPNKASKYILMGDNNC